MAEFKEKGEVDRPIEETRARGGSQLSLEEVEINDNVGDEQLKEFLSDVNEEADTATDDKTPATDNDPETEEN